ncbi:MAG: hypothetical protein AB1793_07825 [Candidatus Thermoplasmatota archaeon]
MATEFEISVSGPTKNLLDAIGVLSSQLVNLETVATAKVEDRYVVRFLTGNDDECRGAFMKADLPFKERKVLVLDVFNRPGQWLRAARCLTDGGVELEGSYLLGQKNDRLRFVFGVSDYEKAKKIVGQITDCSLD